MNLKILWAYINIIRSIPAILALYIIKDKDRIYKDIERNAGKEFVRKYGMILSLNYLLVNMYTFRNIYYFRIKRSSKFIAKLVSIFYLPQKDIEISGDIGGGLQIWHGYGTVIVANKIGENFTAYQGVTIGRNSKIGLEIDTPSIGDNCTVYTNAVVAGNIFIGNNVSIGAGSIVMKNIAENSLVIGSIIKTKKIVGKVNE